MKQFDVIFIGAGAAGIECIGSGDPATVRECRGRGESLAEHVQRAAAVT